MTLTRLIAYAPNGASLGSLPTPQDYSASFVLNDLGALTFTYPLAAPRAADLLGQPREVAVEVSTNGGGTWTEPPGGRFLYLRDGRDPVQRDAWSVECPAYLWRLSKAIVPASGLNADGRRPYVNATVGAILHDLLTAAQGRGALTGLTWNFTATADSSGAAWAGTATGVNIEYDPGKDLLSLLLEFVNSGYVDVRTQGRQVQVYNAGTTMAADRTTGANPVSLRVGRDLTEAPFRRTWEGLADVALVLGDEGNLVERTNAGAVRPWGRQETFVSASGVSDTGTLSVIGDYTLTLSADARTEWTGGLAFGAATFLPFRDYAPGEWVYKVTDPSVAPERMRLRQVTLTRGQDGVYGGNVVLNDRFLEADVQTARKVAGLTGNATLSGTGTTPTPPPVGPDILAPAAPASLTSSSDAYVTQAGRIQAQIALDWPDVTTNADGTPLTDLAGYEVWRRLTSESVGAYAKVADTSGSFHTSSPYEPGTSYTFRVRAVDTVGNEGSWSPERTQVAAADVTPPATPATPTLASSLGVLRITWNGLSSGGGAMDADFARLDVHVSTTSGFTPSASTKVASLTGAGVVPVTGLAGGSVQYVKFVAYDTSNNSSTSAQASATVVRIQGPDLEANTVTTNELAAGSVTADEIRTLVLTAISKIVAGASPNSGPRVELRSDGLYAFDASGETVRITSAGTAEFKGAIKSGSTIDGVTITGSIFRTAAVSGSYVEVNLDGGVKFIHSGVGGGFVRSSSNALWFRPPGTSGIQPDVYVNTTDAQVSNRPSITTTANVDLILGSVASRTGDVYARDVKAAGAVTSASSLTTGETKGASIVSSGSGVFDLAYSGLAAAPVNTNTNGRLVRTPSTRAVKENITHLTLAEAKKVLEMEPVSFQWKDREQMGDARYAGFLAEQAADAGAEYWVSRNADGTPGAIRYAEVTAALVALMRDLYGTTRAMRADLDVLKGTAALKAAVR